jgi:hypothetical protein
VVIIGMLVYDENIKRMRKDCREHGKEGKSNQKVVRSWKVMKGMTNVDVTMGCHTFERGACKQREKNQVRGEAKKPMENHQEQQNAPVAAYVAPSHFQREVSHQKENHTHRLSRRFS